MVFYIKKSSIFVDIAIIENFAKEVIAISPSVFVWCSSMCCAVLNWGAGEFHDGPMSRNQRMKSYHFQFDPLSINEDRVRILSLLLD